MNTKHILLIAGLIGLGAWLYFANPGNIFQRGTAGDPTAAL